MAVGNAEVEREGEEVWEREGERGGGDGEDTETVAAPGVGWEGGGAEVAL